MTRTEYASLTDAEFLREAQHAQDPMTATEIQTELLHRFERVTELIAQFVEVESLLVECSIEIDRPESVAELAEVLQVLAEHHCYDSARLRAKLERADSFYDIAQEAGDVFDQLAELARNTL